MNKDCAAGVLVGIGTGILIGIFVTIGTKLTVAIKKCNKENEDKPSDK